MLSADNPRIRAFYVGDGSTRTTFFRLVDATVLVMTLPDLETFHLKRSVHPVHYVYVFHSMVSTHMIYRKGAFDAYDTILCVGPHHEAEIRRTEEVYGLSPKALVPHGYARLDVILANAAPRRQRVRRGGSRTQAGAGAVVGRLLVHRGTGRDGADRPAAGRAGTRSSLRLHPMTVRRFPKLPGELAQRFSDRAFRVETDMREQASLHEAELMIGDWSGAALEYAFGLERPVLFVDMPKKVNNPEYERIGLRTIEESIRTEVGAHRGTRRPSGGASAGRGAVRRSRCVPGAAARGAGARCLQYRAQCERRCRRGGTPRRCAPLGRPSTDHHMTATKAKALRELLTSDRLRFLMEAHNGLSAKVAEEAGFEGLWGSGLSISASIGVRDNNEMSWTQVLDLVEFMSDAVAIPLLLDGDTGYGNFNNMRRLVQKLETRARRRRVHRGQAVPEDEQLHR